VEIPKFKSRKESDKPKKKSWIIESQRKCTTDNPGIGQSPFQKGKGAWREAGIGVQEKEYVTGSVACPGIHLNGTALRAVDHPGMRLDDLDRPVNTTAVDDDQLKLTLLNLHAVQAGKNPFGLVQRRNNNGDFHGLAKRK
jgi:hypothetical protein